MIALRTWLCTLALLVCFTSTLPAQKLEIPRAQDKPPGPPLSPEEAVAKMTVPEGFTVEIVAAEPDVVNPVGMCIDEKGRFWITESLEYPRREPGPGRDRVKVLEDTDGDGKVDKTTVFAEGLNIPSGIAVGYGGVWVANAPDILFMQDTDGDLKADKIETVVTGFGRDDTHELPNSLTWGPDGWLYGLNGVFNRSHIKYAESNPNYDADHPGWEFTCAMFRIHPRTREFDVFAEGTSNPWGIAFNEEGEAFISACVIDHLWHIVETGYYIRQGGPYPPHTWPMRSIVEHKHQKAAYCGITWFDSDAYPEEYRGVLYMGNIHGGCINADIAERSGSTYKGRPHPGFPAKPGAFDDPDNTIAKIGEGNDAKLADFLTANDAWFMPVVQKTGPDGCLYILDWYDRYHCYQDANADPEGIERAKGRLYRVRYKDTPHAQPFDLAKESDEALIRNIMEGGNEYVRTVSRRLLTERIVQSSSQKTVRELRSIVSDPSNTVRQRLGALWVLASTNELELPTCIGLFQDESAEVQRWSLRFATELANDKPQVELVVGSLGFPSFKTHSTTLLQMAASYPQMIERVEKSRHPDEEVDADAIMPLLLMTARARHEDQVVQQVVWQNLHPLIARAPFELVKNVDRVNALGGIKELQPILSRAVVPMIEAAVEYDRGGIVGTYFLTLAGNVEVDASVARDCLHRIVEAQRTGLLSDTAAQDIRLSSKINEMSFQERLESAAGSPESLLHFDALSLQALWGDQQAAEKVAEVFAAESSLTEIRLDALRTLLAIAYPDTISLVEAALTAGRNGDKSFQANLIETLGNASSPLVGAILLDHFRRLDEEIRPKAIEVLTQRPEWSLELLKAIAAKQVDKDVINLNQLKRVALFKNEELQALVLKTYGAVRSDRRSDRQHVINQQRDFLRGTAGDPQRGVAAFKKVCGQCHTIYGEGAEVGPDITRNGRNNWEQLLQNVFDPSAVIGPGYQARILVTADGRVLTGLPVEESEQRVVLKIQGGKIETIPRDQIDEYAVSDVSMMPEQLEKQLTPQEMADLFAFLALDKPPEDATGRLLPGAPVR